ncbi:MAG: hypothetical protein HPY61_11790 [Methanotrichaceae archaeon]|nr:hypothetical protein [Methanotrichaceae archaeon]
MNGIQLTILALAFAIIPAAGQLDQGSGRAVSPYYQSVGGDFGKVWIQNFLAQSRPPVQTSNNTSLWNWGGSPIDKTIVDGRLVPKDESGTVTIRALDWLGERPLGEPVYLNSSYNLGMAAPMSPLYLSDDPWIRAQQLGTVVRTTTSYQTL